MTNRLYVGNLAFHTTEDDIISWCKDNMAAYKYPRIVQFMDALPKSGAGKVMWRALQEAEAQAQAKVAA